MKRKPIDKSTGQLKSYAVSALYLYIAEQFRHHERTYKQITYAALARHIGLPWVFAGDNAPLIVVLRAALARMESVGMVGIKPCTHDTVLVRLLCSPASCDAMVTITCGMFSIANGRAGIQAR